MKYDFESKNPLWSAKEEKTPGRMEINGEEIQTYPDNDGGYWYYKDGKVVHVHE